MPKIEKQMGEGHGSGELYTLLVAALVDITAQKAIIDSLLTVVTANKTLVNDIRNSVIGDGLVSLPGLAVGTTADHIKTAAFDYIINGITYKKAAVDGTAPGNDVIVQSKYGAVALDIGINGTIDAIEAAGNADPSYASAALAIAGIPAVAADHVRMGTVTVIKSDGTFTFDTTEFSAANITDVFTDETTIFASLGAAVSATVPSASALTVTS